MHSPTVDHRTPTHDGFIWPQPRNRMVDAGAVRQRMAEDISRLVKDRGEDAVIDTDDLIRLGWRPEHVRAYAAAAFSTLPSSKRPRRRGRAVSPREMAASIACLAVPIALIARQMLGL
ncbi:hypothetical protein [Bosea sp. ANAM02]|uniref:hypothetical protein n=1 Tax=Bosea sp. ANAM02 TaxID=2020412 RepID=UPI00140F2D87|nr:hypothetical protein [Bosea sp. ANAM02]BCB18030.1 hypothetical protein OCUBac02_09240 [Bosea sp. ANAM02]